MAESDKRQPSAQRGSKGVVSGVRKSLRAAADYYEGSARAVADGARAFQEQVQWKRALDPASRNGVVGAALTGYARWLDGMAKVARTAAERFGAEDEPEQPSK
jgi:hypothetical protein